MQRAAEVGILTLLISPTLLISDATSIYDRPKRVWGVFLCFLGHLLIWGVLSVQHNLCLYDRVKVSMPPINCCFWRSRDEITLIKPLLCSNRIFPIRMQCFINTRNSDSPIVLKIGKCSFTKITVICKVVIWLDSYVTIYQLASPH